MSTFEFESSTVFDSNNPQQQCSTDNVKGSKHQAAAAEGVCDGAAAGGGVVRECGSDSEGGGRAV